MLQGATFGFIDFTLPRIIFIKVFKHKMYVKPINTYSMKYRSLPIVDSITNYAK